tara:strand:+ start:195 stop:6860 length:6666 start_codon:yes stop_codon:yes gene_type:complete
MRCSLVDPNFSNPYESVHTGVRTSRKGKVSVENGSEFSLLYAEIYNMLKTSAVEVDVEAAKKAYSLYQTIESEDFLEWFTPSNSGHNVNSQGEPKLFGNKSFNTQIAGKEEFWHVLDTNKDTATQRIPLGLDRIPGMSGEQIAEALDVIFAEVLKNKSYTVQDFEDLKYINYEPALLIAMQYKFSLPKALEAAGKTMEPAMKDMWDRVFKDLAYHDPNTGTPNLNSEGRFYLDPNSKLIKLVERRVSTMAGVKLEVTEDEATGALNISPPHFSNPKDGASANTKLLIQSLWKAEWSRNSNGDLVIKTPKSKLTKRSTLVNATKVYAKIQSFLANVHPAKGELDVFPAMIDRLKSLEGHHPEFRELVKVLEDPSTPEYKKTQFVQAFYRPELNYSTTFVEGRSGNSTTIGDPDVQSNEKDILNLWQLKYEDKLTTTSNAGKKILNLKAAKKAVEAFTDLRQRLGFAVRNDHDLYPFKADMLKVLHAIGAEVSKEALDYHIANSSIEGDESIGYSKVLSGLKYVFENSPKPGAVTLMNLVDAADRAVASSSNRPILEDEEGEVKSVINDESGLKILAVSEAVFKEDLIDNTVLGPGGKLYWKYGLYSFLHTTIQKIQQGDVSYVERLKASPYTNTSRWTNWLLVEDRDADGKLNREKFSIKQFLHMVNTETASQGKTFNELMGPDEMVNGITRSIKGMHGTLARGAASTDYSILGPPRESSGVTYSEGEVSFEHGGILGIFKDYILGDFAAQRQAFEDVKNAEATGDMSKMVLHYHYKLNAKTNAPIFFKDGAPVGNVFNPDTMMFPELGYGNEIAEELGLYGKHGDTKGLPLTLTKEQIDSTIIEALIEDSFKRVFKHNLVKAKKLGVFRETAEGSITNAAIDYKLLLEDSEYKELEAEDVAARVLGDYVLNSMIDTRESLSMFVGHPAMYKNVEELPKRAGHFTTPTARLRIYQNSKGEYEVNPQYLHATVSDIFSPSMVLEDPRFRELVGDAVADLWGTTDIADGTTWTTPELFRQRERGLGRWPDSRETAYQNIMNDRATNEDYAKAMFTPVKGTVRGMTPKGAYIVPRIEKTAYMALWPSLVKFAGLQDLYSEMVQIEKDNPGLGAQVAVTSALKAGIGEVGKIDNNNGSVSVVPGSLVFSREAHDNWGLAQDMSTKGFKNTIVGSQAKINIMANIDPDAMYGNLTGEQWLEAVHNVESSISDIGLTEFAEEFGVSYSVDSKGTPSGEVTDKVKFRAKLAEKFLENDNINMVEGLEQEGIPLDAMFQARGKLQSIITNGLKSKTVLYKSLGGSFAQMTGFGLGKDSVRYASLSDKSRSRIRWMVGAERLMPPRLDHANKKVLPGQILLPYKFIKHIKGWENMTDEELKSKIDPKALQIIGYRIPNQSVASMDSLEIVGILPEEVGDTIIAYEAVTEKTGSDYDIDKVFFLLPNLRIDGPEFGNTGKLVRIPSDEGTKKSLENRRIELWEDALQSKDNMKQVMYPTDSGFLQKDAESIREMIEANNPETNSKGRDIMLGMKMVSPDYQSSLRERFIIGGKMVAAVANNIVDHVNSMQSGFELNEDIGIGYSFTHETLGSVTSLYEGLMQGSELYISQILSAYMNANVDIEKNPYISYTNFNPNTSNVGFLLLRAGVPLTWVNRFLAQPILRELSDTMNALGSEAVPGKTGFKEAVKKVKSSFLASEETEVEDTEEEKENTKDPITGDLRDVLSISKLNSLLKNAEESKDFLEYQEYILDKFEFLKDIADPVFGQLLATKVSTKAGGKNLAEARIMRNNKEKAMNDPLFSGFDTKFAGTMLESYYNNSVEFLLNVFEKEFLSTSEFMDTGLNVILTLTGDTYSNNVDTHTKIINKMYSYMYSGFFDSNKASELMFDTKEGVSFAKEFRAMEKAKPNSILLKLMNASVKNESIPSYISARGSKSVPSDIINLAYREWEDMYIDPNTKEFASKMVHMAFLVGGFNDSLASFHRMIPMQWSLESGFAEYVKNVSSELREGSSSVYIPEMVSQIMRHEFKNPEFVPNFTEYEIGNIYRTADQASIGGYNKGKALALPKSIGLELKGSAKLRAEVLNVKIGDRTHIDYKRFIRYDIPGQEKVVPAGYIGKDGKPVFKTVLGEDTPALYEFIGIDPNTSNPIYLSRDPLGHKAKGGISINEYKFDQDSVENTKIESIFEGNNTAFRLTGKQELGHANRFSSFWRTLKSPMHYSNVVEMSRTQIKKC